MRQTDREFETSSIDFTALGEKLLGEAMVASERSTLEGMLAPHLAQLQGPDRRAVEAVISVLTSRMAVTNSAIRALSQELVAARRSREARLRIDPLPSIPLDRFEVPPALPVTWECSAADAGFVGSNWHRLESDQTSNWRWAGPALASSVLLPSLGGGRIRVEIEFKIPFRASYAPDTLTVFLDGIAVPTVKMPDRNVCEGTVDIPEDLLGSGVTLIVVSKGHSDPSLQDPRVLGIGLICVRLARTDGYSTARAEF